MITGHLHRSRPVILNLVGWQAKFKNFRPLAGQHVLFFFYEELMTY
jgi:hypothetical protein